jgi:hypothetical protein
MRSCRLGAAAVGIVAVAALGGCQAPPTPADPYPADAAGFGPRAGQRFRASRWAEDWTAARAAGTAPPLKAMPLPGGAALSLSAESRLRGNVYDQVMPRPGERRDEGLFRGVLGADLRLDPRLRVYGEVATGQVDGRAGSAPANFQNDASLQQLFADLRTHTGAVLLGAMVGRQEFADGPRQLVSLGDGPNLHRTWNGVRLYAHGERYRLGAFDLRATHLARGTFDEQVDHADRLQGLVGGLVLAAGRGSTAYLDPFWYHSEQPDFRVGDDVDLDRRDTYGARFWGRGGAWRWDWTAARQTGEHGERDVDAWAVFAVQSLSLANDGWRPRLTSHVDLASGGGSHGTGTVRTFHPLYASSSYLGEGRLLSLSNLLLVAPGLSLSPTPSSELALECGFARRLSPHDAAFAGGMRAYPGTQDVGGRGIGTLLRAAWSWSATDHVTVSVGFERLEAGDVLERAGLPSGNFLYASTTIRW